MQAEHELEVGAIVRALRAQDDASPAATQREAALLEWLVTNYTAQRSFCTPAAAGLPSPDDFRELFSVLVAARFANDNWWNQAPEANRLLVLQSLRLLMRDAALQEQWAAEPGATSSFAARLHHYAAGYGSSGSSEFNLEIVGELAAMAKRLVRTHQHGLVTHFSAPYSLILSDTRKCLHPACSPSISLRGACGAGCSWRPGVAPALIRRRAAALRDRQPHTAGDRGW